MGVEGIAVIQRLLGDIADECRRDLIWLTKPEREHISAAHTGIGDFAYAGRAQGLNR